MHPILFPALAIRHADATMYETISITYYFFFFLQNHVVLYFNPGYWIILVLPVRPVMLMSKSRINVLEAIQVFDFPFVAIFANQSSSIPRLRHLFILLF